ncbi:nickel/cobalt transporter [Hyphomicrobiales bacterium 4NK60-0047b]|jgi:ABC-type nickel/cobalt efflux system permease component RcnA
MKFNLDMSEFNIASLVLSVLLIMNSSSASFANPHDNDPLQKIQLAEKVNTGIANEDKTGRSLSDFGKRSSNENNVPAGNNNLKPKNEKSLWQSLTIWVYQKQVVLSNTLTGYLQQFKKTNDYTFAVMMIGLSFLYGLVHAAGPGHGKVVVSSYIMANNQTMRRGIFLSFLSSLVQGTVAVSLVAIPALIFSASGSTIKKLGLQFTQVSYVLIILLGIYLLYSLLSKKWKAYTAQSHKLTHDHSHSHAHNHDHRHGHSHDHDEDCGCGHSHIPSAEEVQGKWDLAKIVSLVLSVGLRPCTGALYVLALALIKDVFWIGVISVYAMALGTAITISLVTMTVVGGRRFAYFSSGGNSRFGSYVYDFCTLGGAVMIIFFGSVLLSSSFTPVSPF